MMVQTAGTEPGRQKRPGRRPLLVFFAVLGALVAAAIVAGVLPRIARQKVMLAASETRASRKPVVIVSAAHFVGGQEDIDLPGDLQAIVESPIFARADGYLKTRFVDIGDRLKKGQPMADLETPELDQQISQAGASLAQARSHREGTAGRPGAGARQPGPVAGDSRPLAEAAGEGRRVASGNGREGRPISK